MGEFHKKRFHKIIKGADANCDDDALKALTGARAYLRQHGKTFENLFNDAPIIQSIDHSILRENAAHIEDKRQLSHEISKLSSRLRLEKGLSELTLEDCKERYGEKNVTLAMEITENARVNLPFYKVFKNPSRIIAIQWLYAIERAVRDAGKFGEKLNFEKVLKGSGEELESYISRKDPEDLSNVIYFSGSPETIQKVKELHGFETEPSNENKSKSPFVKGVTSTFSALSNISVATILCLHLASYDEEMAKKINSGAELIQTQAKSISSRFNCSLLFDETKISTIFEYSEKTQVIELE